jgi:hypothetical protein
MKNTCRSCGASLDGEVEVPIADAPNATVAGIVDLREHVRTRKPKVFVPGPHYSEAGDFIFCYFKDADSYEGEGGPGWSVLRSFDTHEVVGVKVHGVKRMVAGKNPTSV